MHLPRVLAAAATAFALLGTLYAFQRSFREYPGIEYNTFPLPPDFEEKTEWTFARLMYPQTSGRFGFRRGGDWAHGNSMWTQDYPRADRHFLRAMRRLTRLHTRSVEQPVIAVPAITFDGTDDGVRPPAAAQAAAHRFGGPRSHRIVPGVGHNMPQEVPQVFAEAVLELVRSQERKVP